MWETFNTRTSSNSFSTSIMPYNACFALQCLGCEIAMDSGKALQYNKVQVLSIVMRMLIKVQASHFQSSQ